MSKLCMKLREIKRREAVVKYKDRRAVLVKIVKDPKASFQEKQDAMLALQDLPRDSSPVRQRNRCSITGRPRGVYRKFGLGRSKLRELAMRGEIPGLVKASW
ncbi:MAG: 30S ribosomal protein S14 [Gammaproteobacteria bacterium]